MEEFSRELPDLGGAAVRGEAVAESDLTTIKCPFCNGHGLIGGHSGQTPESYEEHSEGCDDCDGQGKIIVSKSDLAAFVSARAADAPSEQSELVLAFGKGLIEVGQGHHGNERKPAILFGRNGAGAVGIETEGDRVMLPGECIAALTFDNPESLEVVAEKFAELRGRIWPESRASNAPSALGCLTFDQWMDRVDENGWTEREAPCGEVRDMLRGWNAAMKFGKSRAADALDSQPTFRPWQKLWDSQWVNIVNHDQGYESMDKVDAVHLAVKMTEERLKLNNTDASSQPTDGGVRK